MAAASLAHTGCPSILRYCLQWLQHSRGLQVRFQLQNREALPDLGEVEPCLAALQPRLGPGRSEAPAARAALHLRPPGRCRGRAPVLPPLRLLPRLLPRVAHL